MIRHQDVALALVGAETIGELQAGVRKMTKEEWVAALGEEPLYPILWTLEPGTGIVRFYYRPKKWWDGQGGGTFA